MSPDNSEQASLASYAPSFPYRPPATCSLPPRRPRRAVEQGAWTMASVNHGNTGRRKHSVWNDFHRVNVPGGTGVGAMAMCKRCGTTLQASAKKHGTSHLRRHAQSSCCAKRAAVRDTAAAPVADGDTEEVFSKWLEDLLVEPEHDFAGRLVIAGGHQVADAGGDVAAAGNHGRLSPNFIPDPLPQAPTSSSMRFFQKRRERSASLASHEGGTKDKDNSSRAKDWAPTVDNSTFDDMDFTSRDWE